MRILLEVIACGQETAKFKRKNGGMDEVPLFWFSGVDTDFGDELFKVKVYRDFQKLHGQIFKGARVALKFRSMRPANQWEKTAVITANADDVTLHKAEGERKMAVAGGESL